ncbi:HET-domain-containing protein [Sporormia fimetaria CBS 119925]|uniref:HET-domain-containing protein n=1 Tax=Sporormia fimetaria CBS 119925 TaxID=1340428 RepID=A0A6A6UY58_9PLEO|nr:HET-domain-containing protein [Sporormia fimetaria CBS 119925]
MRKPLRGKTRPVTLVSSRRRRRLYIYSPLPAGPHSFRLLRLWSHGEDIRQPFAVECELHTYTAQDALNGNVPEYDALSYVWGDSRDTVPILVSGEVLMVTKNLCAALERLARFRHSEGGAVSSKFGSRAVAFIWVDAICINQKDLRERGRQVRHMSTIYARARQVIVWLGEETNTTHTAFDGLYNRIELSQGPESSSYTKKEKDIYQANRSDESGDWLEDAITEDANKGGDLTTERRSDINSEHVKVAIYELLDRPWFRRIWVLQEVAAADAILVVCGKHWIEGRSFCARLVRLSREYQIVSSASNSIRAVLFLIRHRHRRDSWMAVSNDMSSLRIRPLSQLLDMYHSQEASDRHDKVYALLGLRSDLLDVKVLEPDYSVPWSQLFSSVVKLVTNEDIPVLTSDDGETALLRTRIKFLGEVVSVTQSTGWGDGQKLEIASRNTSKYFGGHLNWFMRTAIHSSASRVEAGDLLCALPGTSKPTIIRIIGVNLCIIVIDATGVEEIWGEDLHRSVTWSEIMTASVFFPKTFDLLWDWSKYPSQEQPRIEETHKPVDLAEMENMQPGLQEADESVDVAELENMGLLLEALGNSTTAKSMFEAAWHHLKQRQPHWSYIQATNFLVEQRKGTGTADTVAGLCSMHKRVRSVNKAEELHAEYVNIRKDVEEHRSNHHASLGLVERIKINESRTNRDGQWGSNFGEVGVKEKRENPVRRPFHERFVSYRTDSLE